MFRHRLFDRRFSLRQPTRLKAFAAGNVILAAVLSIFSHVSFSRAADSTDIQAVDVRQKIDATDLAARIDAVVEEAWAAEQIVPAAAADDAELVRRIYLDLVGKIPAVADVRGYLTDSSPEKRGRLVNELLSSAAHATHWANTWRELLLAGSNNDPQFRASVPAFEAWLRLRFAADISYDRLVDELLTAPLDVDPQPVVNLRPDNSAPSPAAFYLANQRKAENLATGASRAFLGLQVGCAQCHDHPFAKWSREDFWSFAAFFDVTDGDSVRNVTDRVNPVAIEIPDTEITVGARFLGGTEPDWEIGQQKRATLSGWITKRNNPYFARATVNRLWASFFGRGFVDPVDDLDEANPPSHPELFAEISRQFVAHGYDMKYVIRAITATRAYRLSSRTTDGVDGQRQAEHFARMPLRRLTAEQLYDSLVQATGFRAPREQQQNLLVDNSTRSEFVRNFTEPGQTGSTPSTSIIQALSLMNGRLVAGATGLSQSENLTAVAEAPFLDDTGRVETLFLATLSRPPDESQRASFVEYIEAAQSPDEKRSALGDVFWALLNSAEFVMNH